MSDDDAAIRLLDKPIAEWTRDELRDGFIALSEKYIDAMKGWGEVLEHCEWYQSALKDEMQNNRMLSELLRTTGQSVPKVKPRRGRPRKHKDLSWLLEWHGDAVKQFGNLTDTKLITASFREMHKRVGLREGRVNAPDFKKKMESMRKLLVKARTAFRLSQK